MTQITFTEILKALKNARFPDCRLVVGIAEGGIIPAALVASKLGCDLRIVKFNYRNAQNIPQHLEPLLLSKVNLPKDIKSILLVDDVAMSGKTLDAAKKLFKNYEVTTVALRGKADYVLFPKLSSCVRWPWKV